MIVKFWGVRGSIPVPGHSTIKYGGNTACVEIRCGRDIIIIDGGTGLRTLGLDLMKRGFAPNRNNSRGKGRAHIFFSHMHWDHIQGFPFFAPAFIKGNRINIYGFKHLNVDLQQTLRGQQELPNYPVSIFEMGSDIKFIELSESDIIRINRAIVTAVRLNHPGGSFGYKISSNGKSLVYACDYEHFDGMDRKLINFAKGSDAIIYDAQYTPEEYSGNDSSIGKQGWGHSTWEKGVELVKSAAINKLILFHHGHSDEEMEKIERTAKKKFRNTIAAYEGLEIKL
jgi:phosphoribosyl 1,2-cyclic phosphodiesterase